jgi:hypothetical protein
VDNHTKIEQSTIVHQWVLHVSMSFMPLITATEYEREVEEKRSGEGAEAIPVCMRSSSPLRPMSLTFLNRMIVLMRQAHNV